ncbi:hypothetical protein [Actinospica robiniae]|uniref:hypothetical protein n=1 Tax=Actinospica robiniae TaxID=304901 RepID=UPI00041E6D4E|nr:hypothetical protein [Actinospica robiniae]
MTVPIAHAHEEALALQPLPACLAPSPTQAATFLQEFGPYIPTARLPRTGEPVVFEGGHVTWLAILDDTRPVTKDNSLLMSAGRLTTGPCGDVEWSRTYGVEPEDPNLEPEDAATLPTVRDLLIAHANADGPTS